MKNLASFVPANQKITIASVVKHATSANIYVATTSTGSKYAIGAKSLPEIQLNDDNTLVEGTYKTFESAGVNWLAPANAGNAVLVL